MSKRKLIKKIFMEAFQWAAFATPLFVTGQRLAIKECYGDVCTDSTTYWLLITAVVAYVAGITLVVWLPVKIFIVWKKVFRPYEGLWFPGNFLYLIFSAIPCVVFVFIAQNSCTGCFDFFRGAPMETLVIMFVVTDWSEKIRYIKLRSSDDTTRRNKYTSAPWDSQRGTRLESTFTIGNGDVFDSSRRSSHSQSSLLHPSVRNGTLMQRIGRSLKWIDARPENLLRDVMQAYDTRILLDLSTITTVSMGPVFETGWIYPIYILTLTSFLPMIVAPSSDTRSSLTVIFQDIPFFFLRLSIYSAFGSELVLQTSVMYLLKNFFVSFAFVYFNVVLPRWSKKKALEKYKLEMMNNKNSPNGNARGISNPQMEENNYNGENEFSNYEMVNPGYDPGRQQSSNHSPIHRHNSRIPEIYQHGEYQDEEGEDASYLENLQYAVQRQISMKNHAHHSTTAHVEYIGESTTDYFYQDFQDEGSDEEFANEAPEEPAAPPPPPPEVEEERLVIDYDTLHNPKSFLYNQDRRPVIHDIKFEDDTSSAQAQIPPQTKENQASQRSNATPGTSSQTEVPKPTYAVIDRTKKSNRRKAPAPPVKPKKSVRTKSQETLDNLPPPPPPEALVNGYVTKPAEQDYSKLNGERESDDFESESMSADLEHKLAMEAVSALEEAAKYGAALGADWSRNTTPRNTYSMKLKSAPVLSIPKPNEEEYDIRL